MTKGLSIGCAAAWVFATATAAAAPETFPLSAVKRGQTGYGMTTMHGTVPERFTFEVVDVVKNFQPKMDIILVKSDDPKVQVSGFWQGMSGSPLYIENKLVCAFSYGFRFNKVALGGCTPIETMKEEGFSPVPRRDVIRPKRGGPGVVAPEAATFADWEALVPNNDIAAYLGRGSQWLSTPPRPARPPLATAKVSLGDAGAMTASVPLAVSGFTAPAFSKIEELFAGDNLVPHRAGGTSVASGGPTEFTLGGAIAVELIRGDMSIAGTGTVSYIDGNRVLAFGHPMFQAGEFYAPVSTARIHTVVPSALSAFVMASPANEIGALVQDRQSMIMANTDLRSPMIPLDISVTSTAAKQTTKGEFHVEVLRSKWLTPPLVGAAIMNAVSYHAPDRDNATARVEASIKLPGVPALTSIDYLYAPDGATGLANGIRALRIVPLLLASPWGSVQIERIELKIDLKFEANYGEIKEIRLPSAELPPGQRSWLQVVVEGDEGKRSIDRVPVDVPASLAGSIVSLDVTSGDSARVEAAPPVDAAGLVKRLRMLLPGTVYAVTINAPGEGVTMDGILVRDLPASALDRLAPAAATPRGSSHRPMAQTLSPAKRVLNGAASITVRISDRR